jgi:hypothetical protein
VPKLSAAIAALQAWLIRGAVTIPNAMQPCRAVLDRILQ